MLSTEKLYFVYPNGSVISIPFKPDPRFNLRERDFKAMLPEILVKPKKKEDQRSKLWRDFLKRL